MSVDLTGSRGGLAYTPSDTAVISRQTRGFQLAVAGDVALEYPDGSIVVWPACVAGVVHAHFGFVRVRATGTTATGVVLVF